MTALGLDSLRTAALASSVCYLGVSRMALERWSLKCHKRIPLFGTRWLLGSSLSPAHLFIQQQIFFWHLLTVCQGGGNGNPLVFLDRGAWHAIVHRVAKTQLCNLERTHPSLFTLRPICVISPYHLQPKGNLLPSLSDQATGIK